MITGVLSGILRLVSYMALCGYNLGQTRHAFPHIALSRKQICAGYVRDVSSSSEVGCRDDGDLVYPNITPQLFHGQSFRSGQNV